MNAPSNDSDSRVLAFAQDAQAYCDFIDRLTKGKTPNCYSDLLRLHSNLAVSGLDLPFAMPERDVQRNSDVSHSEWSQLAKSIGDSIATEASLLVEQHADNEDELTRAAMVWDDLADIYRDLVDGLRLFNMGDHDARLEAVWKWRFGYENHWGSHLMRALATVHEIRFFIRAD